jgi:hypothetical protein
MMNSVIIYIYDDVIGQRSLPKIYEHEKKLNFKIAQAN